MVLAETSQKPLRCCFCTKVLAFVLTPPYTLLCADCGALMAARSLAVQVDIRPRCWRCGRLLLESATRPWSVTCSRCKAQNRSAPVDETAKVS